MSFLYQYLSKKSKSEQLMNSTLEFHWSQSFSVSSTPLPLGKKPLVFITCYAESDSKKCLETIFTCDVKFLLFKFVNSLSTSWSLTEPRLLFLCPKSIDQKIIFSSGIDPISVLLNRKAIYLWFSIMPCRKWN